MTNTLTDYSCPDCAHLGPHYHAGAWDSDGNAVYRCGDCGAKFCPNMDNVHDDEEAT